jgi:hypothetical protein
MFDRNTSKCWWHWVPYRLDSSGHEVYDFDKESERAWDAFQAENDRRSKLRDQWFLENSVSSRQHK